jgi:hypothetical protein
MYLWLTDLNPLFAVILCPGLPLIFGVCGYFIGKKIFHERRNKREIILFALLGILIGLQFACMGSAGYWVK